MKEFITIAFVCCGIAVAATIALRPASVDDLIEQTADPDPNVRRRAVKALGNQGDEAKMAISVLKNALEDENFAVRVYAGVALTKLGITDGEVPITPFEVPALIEALEDRDRDVRDSAREGLANVGSFAVPRLVEQLQNEDISVRFAVLSILGSIGPDAYEATPALSKYIHEETENGPRWSAINVLGRIGPGARAAVPALIRVLEGDNANDRRHAVNSLGAIGPAAAAIPTLKKALQDEDQIVRMNAKLALKKLQP